MLVCIIPHTSKNLSSYIRGTNYYNIALLVILNFTYFLFKSKSATVSVDGINYISIITLSESNTTTINILVNRLSYSTNGNGAYELFIFLPYNIGNALSNTCSIPTTLLNSEYTLIESNWVAKF